VLLDPVLLVLTSSTMAESDSTISGTIVTSVLSIDESLVAFLHGSTSSIQGGATTTSTSYYY